MSKTTKELNTEIAKLRATARAAEKVEYEDFGRWVVDQLAQDMKGAPSERIQAARVGIASASVAHHYTDSVGHAEDENESPPWGEE